MLSELSRFIIRKALACKFKYQLIVSAIDSPKLTLKLRQCLWSVIRFLVV